jgi:hypothetical protein
MNLDPRMLSRFAGLALAASAPLWAQGLAAGLVWAEGAGLGSRSIMTVPEADLLAAPRLVLADVELLDLEVTNRTAQQDLADDRARRVERQGLARVVLPDGGSLYRYRRAGGTVWGFLWIDVLGVARVVLEQNGAQGGAVDPFFDRIAVGPDGRHALVPFVDGRLAIVRLDGGVFASSGTPARVLQIPFGIENVSHTCGRSVGWFVADDDTIWRVALADGAQPQDVTPPSTGAVRAKPEFAPSADGRSAAFIFGPRNLARLWLVGEQGPAVLVPIAAGDFEEPGYLPEVVGGPKLLLNEDGSSLLCVDATIRDEAFVVDVSGLVPNTHWTGDPNFQPYIGVIILPLAVGDVFVAGIGDPNRFDLHAAVAGGVPTVNLTQTNGNVSAPFQSGALVPSAMTTFRDGSFLASLAPSTGGAPHAFQFGPFGIRAHGAAQLGEVARGASTHARVSADLLVPTSSGELLLAGADGAPVVPAPAGLQLSTSVIGPNGAYRSFFVSSGALRALVVDVPGLGFFGYPANGAEDVVLSESGALALEGSGSILLLSSAGSRNIATAADTLILSGQGVR